MHISKLNQFHVREQSSFATTKIKQSKKNEKKKKPILPFFSFKIVKREDTNDRRSNQITNFLEQIDST